MKLVFPVFRFSPVFIRLDDINQPPLGTKCSEYVLYVAHSITALLRTTLSERYLLQHKRKQAPLPTTFKINATEDAADPIELKLKCIP